MLLYGINSDSHQHVATTTASGASDPPSPVPLSFEHFRTKKRQKVFFAGRGAGRDTLTVTTWREESSTVCGPWGFFLCGLNDAHTLGMIWKDYETYRRHLESKDGSDMFLLETVIFVYKTWAQIKLGSHPSVKYICVLPSLHLLHFCIFGNTKWVTKRPHPLSVLVLPRICGMDDNIGASLWNKRGSGHGGDGWIKGPGRRDKMSFLV